MEKVPYSIVNEVGKNGKEGWVAMTLAEVPTTHTTFARETAEQVVELVRRMQGAGMLDGSRPIEVVR